MSITMTRKLVRTAIFSLLLTLVSITAQAGYYYESTTTTKGAGPNSEQKVKGWVDGDSARVEFVTGDRNGHFAKGNYLVTTDGGENVYLINPGEKTYGAFNLEEMMATLGQAMDMMGKMGDMVKMEFSDASSEKLLEEPGEAILGLDTTHYRFKSGYTMSMGIMGIRRESRNESLVDIWTTDELDAVGFGVWLKPGRQMKTGNEELDKIMGQQMGMLQGYPLKMVMESSSSGAMSSGSTITTMDVTTLREEAVDGSQFTWPDSYTEIEIVPDIQKAMGNARKK